MLVSYMLFVYGTFEDHDEIEFFCMEVMAGLPSVESLKYVIEGSQNIIVIFDVKDGKDSESKLRDEISEAMTNHTVKFYFLFKRDDLQLSYIPTEVKDFIYRPSNENIALKVEFIKKPHDFDLNEVLEKIEKEGIDSLTPDEKKFLDNFEK